MKKRSFVTLIILIVLVFCGCHLSILKNIYIYEINFAEYIMKLSFYSQGTDVMLLQSTLKKIGYYTGDVDGLYGFDTFSAVKKFQTDNSLTPDGIVGPKTYAALEPYIYGFTYHTIKPGDTLYKIAVQYNSTIKSIQIANPAVKADNLQPGAEIIVPFNYDVVDTNINYTYKILQTDVSGLTARYPFLEVFTSGASVLGRDLIGLRLGIGETKVFYAASHHSLEWITSVVMMKFVEDYCDAYANGTTLSGFDIRKLFTQVSIYIVPMVNPDGIELVLNGLSPSNPNYDNLIKYNNGSTDFSKNWEANNNGVDLNHNYNASWEEAKAASAELGITSPGPTRWGGDYPFSEPETKGVSSYVDTSNFALVLAYHSQGEVIFYNYLNIDVANAVTIGNKLSEVSGYALERIDNIGQFAGFKDWFIKEFTRPGYTVEVGKGTNPLPISQFDKIYKDNLPLLLTAADEAINL